MLFLSADFFFNLKSYLFSKNSFRNTIRVVNGLDPDQDRQNVGSDLGINKFAKVIGKMTKVAASKEKTNTFQCFFQSEEIFLDMFEDEYREMTVSVFEIFIPFPAIHSNCHWAP